MKRIALMLAAVVALLPATAHAAFAGRNGAIAYGWSARTTHADTIEFMKAVRLVAPNGGAAHGLATCDEVVPRQQGSRCVTWGYGDPAFSPDGSWVAFNAEPSLAVVGADSTGLRLLPAHSLDDGEPSFSPTGSRLAFSAAGRTLASARNVWISDADGTHARELVASAVDPAWSAHNWIAFSRGGQIYLIRPDGSGLHQFTRAGGDAPAWSPHGFRLAFTRAAGVFVADADGRHTHRVSRSGQEVAWSPDGTELAIRVRGRGVVVLDLRTRRGRTVVSDTHTGGSVGDAIGGVDWQPLR